MAGPTACNKCGSTNEQGAIYCAKCGAKIGSTGIGRTFAAFGKILAGFIIFVVLIIGIALCATSGVAEAVKNQLTAIREGDYAKAYSYTSTEFQKNTSLDEFKMFIDNVPALKNNERISINNRSFENDKGEVKGSIHSKDGIITPIEYQLIKENGEWKILGIDAQLSKSTKKDNQSTNSIEPADTAKESTATQTNIAPVVKSTADSGALAKTYHDTGSNFTLKHPSDWELDQTNPSVVMVKKVQQGPGFANVNIQKVLTKQSGGEYANVDEFLSSIETQGKAEFTDFKLLGENSEALPSNPDKVKGKSITFSYKHNGIDIKQLQIILMEEDGKHFYMWGYTASSDEYDKNLPISDAMMDSWEFN